MPESMSEEAIRMGRSHFRGHPIWWSEAEQIWRYSDNNEPIPQGGGEARPCLKCGQKEWSGDGAFDACLGNLPGVTNACCGHGEPSGAYVCFKGGVVLRGFTVERSASKEGNPTDPAVPDDVIAKFIAEKKAQLEQYVSEYCHPEPDTNAGVWDSEYHQQHAEDLDQFITDLEAMLTASKEGK